MQLTDQQIKKFQAIYKEEFNKEISKAEALEKGLRLVELIKVVYKPLPKEDLEKFKI